MTDGTVLVDFCGLSVVEFRSVVTYESAMFGSNFRGYLIAFRYMLINGPYSTCSMCVDHQFLTIYATFIYLDYSDIHVVCRFILVCSGF